MQLESLCFKLASAKLDMISLKAEIAALEKEIISVFPEKLEGSQTKKTDGYKVTVTNKLLRKLDVEAYQAMDLPENAQFVDYKPTINISRMRAVEQLEPSIVEACVTIKPAKSSIKISEV